MSEENIDLNEELFGTDDMGGFELPPTGNIDQGTGVLMEFTGEIKECGENEESLGFELGYVENPSAKARIFCKTTSKAGLQRIIGIGKNSGVFDKIETKRKKAGKKSILSAEGGIIPKILVDKKFHAQLRAEIEGCTVLCTITHSEAKPYEDKDGNTKEGFPQANIGKIGKPGSQKKAVKTAEKKDDGADDNSEWE